MQDSKNVDSDTDSEGGRNKRGPNRHAHSESKGGSSDVRREAKMETFTNEEIRSMSVTREIYILCLTR